MTSRKLASAAAAASLAGVAVLGLGTPAIAQTTEPCYPPPCAAGISDSTVVPGQTVTANSGSGSFVAGASVDVMVLGVNTTRTADASGNVTVAFKVPDDTRPGRFSVVFSNSTNRVEVPFTVVSAAAAGPGQGQRFPSTGSGLPLTGADQLVPLTITGVALVGIGVGIVVASRRRRETSMPAGLA